MKQKKILFISSSGGHYEQLQMLKPLIDKYDSCIITEKTEIDIKAKYYMAQTNHKDKKVYLKLLYNMVLAILIWIKEKPTHIVSTGSMIVLPYAMLAKITRKKIIFIETFSRISDTTKTGRFMYKHSDLFIVQWESLLEHYPNAVYGGSIY